MTLRSNALVSFQLRPELCSLNASALAATTFALLEKKGVERERERERVRCEPKVMQNAIAANFPVRVIVDN